MSEINEIGISEIHETNEINFSFEDILNDMFDYTEAEEYAHTEEVKDAREYKLDECAEIAKKFFTYEVLNEWGSYSIEKRKEILENYSKAIARELGTNISNIIVENMDRYTEGYNNGDGKIHINIDIVHDPANVIKLIDVVSHETRHQFQREVIQDAERFGIEEKTAYEWEVGMKNYTTNCSTQYDPWGYFYNPVETDARFFGESMVREVTKDLIVKNSVPRDMIPHRMTEQISFMSSKYDDKEYNAKAMEAALERGDYTNAKKHAGRL